MKSKSEEMLFKERQRIQSLKEYEYQAYKEGYKYIAGIDEAGRGPIAGPVTAAAVILPPDFFLTGVDDSKKLSPAKRIKLVDEIKRQAVSWSVAFVYPSYIEKVNILNATREAMKLAVKALSPLPLLLLIDALKLPDLDIKQRPIIKGDSKSISIACASILAKVERDWAMESFDLLYPGYKLSKHKGYATKEHLAALMKKGPSVIHRVSFEPVKSMVDDKQPGLFGYNA